jgi:uncharacterized protein
MRRAVGTWRSAAAAAIALLGLTAFAAQELPALSGPVTDRAKVIDPDTAAELDRRIRALESASGDVVVVVTVETIAPAGSIEEYAVRLFEKAGVGERGKDNGVLILLAETERRVRIEVGYGLEEFITDGFAGDTIRQAMLPAFRDGRMGDGLLSGTTRVIQRIADARGVTLTGVPAEEQEVAPEVQIPIVPLVLAVFIAIMMLRAMARQDGRRFRRRGWPGHPWGGTFGGFGGGYGGGFGGGGFRGGGGFGGFGGFGGGRSGGGGASGGW